MKTQRTQKPRTDNAVSLRHGLGVLPNLTEEQKKILEQFYKTLNGELPIYEMEITIPKNIQTDEIKIKIEIDAFCNVKYRPLLYKNGIKIFSCNHKMPLAFAIAAMLPQTTLKSLKFGNVLSCLAELLDNAGVNVYNKLLGKTKKAGLPETISSTIFSGSLEATGLNKQTSSLKEPSDFIKSQNSHKDDE